MSSTEISDQKAALRRQAMAAASAAASAYGEEAGVRVAKAFFASIPLEQHSIISGYAPLKSEIDPMPLLTQLHKKGHTIALPHVEGKYLPLTMRRWKPGQKLVAGQLGTSQPEKTSDELLPNIVITPLLGFDRQGHRLGRGGGFYDRTIMELRARGPVLAIGIAFSAQELPAIPHEAHDQRLDWIVTEERAFQIKA